MITADSDTRELNSMATPANGIDDSAVNGVSGKGDDFTLQRSEESPDESGMKENSEDVDIGDAEACQPRSIIAGIMKHKFLIFAAAVASLSAGQFGYALGMLNNIRPVLISDFQSNTTCSVDFDANNLSTKSSKVNFELATAMICVGGLISSLLAGPCADRFGRKKTLLGNNAIFIISGLIMGFAQSFPALIVGRVFQGFGAGCGLVVVATYLGEIGPTSLRGSVGAAGQVAISICIFFATMLGLPDLLGTCELWNVVVGGPILLAVLQLVSLPFVPESPKFLYINRHQLDNAKDALHRLRGAGVSVEGDVEEMEAEKATQATLCQSTFWQDLRDRRLRFRFLLTTILHASQQLSGINGVFFYSSAIYSSAGLTNVAVVALVPALVNVIATIVSFKIVDRLGRRKLMLIGLSGLVLSHLVLTAGFSFNKQFFEGTKGSNWTSALTITGSLAVVVSFSLGPGPIPWLIVSELFPQSSRAKGYIVAGVVNWLTNYLVGQFFLDVLLGLDPYGFLIFAGIAAFLLAAVFFLQPETKGKRIEEIDDFFRTEADKSSGVALLLLLGREEIGAR